MNSIQNMVELVEMYKLPECVKCKHLEIDLDSDISMTCAGFPNGIPSEILVSKKDHRKPYPGDHGIQFEAI